MEGNKEPIRIRKKKLANGNISLYLDIYSRGVRRYEFLRLYLISEKTREDKERNRQTMQLANAIKSKRIVEIQNMEYGFRDTDMMNVRFFDYCDEVRRRRSENFSDKTIGGWNSTIRMIREYEKDESITFRHITKEWVDRFKRYMRERDTKMSRYARPLSRNTQHIYFCKLKAILNSAVKDGILATNPALMVEPVRMYDTEREYLTIEEIKKMSGSKCHNGVVKKAFLFSCLTGMRRSDIIALRWGDVYDNEGMTRIVFRQQKTKRNEYIDINRQATELMGERGNDNDRVFDLPSIMTIGRNVKELAENAGIRKKITFHCARHTFATMMLGIGTDIYTVSKLLGHSNLTTTQIYAKIVDKNKQKAVMNIPDIL